jgi:pyruvate dehydrogenase (quinone)
VTKVFLHEHCFTRSDKPLKPQVVAYHLNRFPEDDAIICSDTGAVTTWAARYIEVKDRMMFSASGILMGEDVWQGVEQ